MAAGCDRNRFTKGFETVFLQLDLAQPGGT